MMRHPPAWRPEIDPAPFSNRTVDRQATDVRVAVVLKDVSRLTVQDPLRRGRRRRAREPGRGLSLEQRRYKQAQRRHVMSVSEAVASCISSLHQCAASPMPRRTPGPAFNVQRTGVHGRRWPFGQGHGVEEAETTWSPSLRPFKSQYRYNQIF